MSVKAIILCAGMGTRLGALTQDTPKPMLRVCDRPLVEYSVRALVAAGISEIGINLHYRADQLTDYLQDGTQYGASIHYCHEEELLGTAGALPQFLPWIGETKTVLVLYGDVVTSQNFKEFVDFHWEREALASITVHRRSNSNSVVEFDEEGLVTHFLERPSEQQGGKIWVNSGVQCIERSVIEFLCEKEAFDLPRDVFPDLISKRSLYAFPYTGTRVAVDSEERLSELEKAVKAGQIY